MVCNELEANDMSLYIRHMLSCGGFFSFSELELNGSSSQLLPGITKDINKLAHVPAEKDNHLFTIVIYLNLQQEGFSIRAFIIYHPGYNSSLVAILSESKPALRESTSTQTTDEQLTTGYECNTRQ